MTVLTADQVMQVFAAGGTDHDYLCTHLPRFLNTYTRFDASWDRRRGIRLLDIGAHWLHQAVVFRLGGFEVTAADLPTTLEMESVRRLAQEQGIRLTSYRDLSAPGSLAGLDADSMNVVLMAEIVEHITFNPVELWKEVHRVIAPGGRIILTTPNYYWAGGRAWQWRRFIGGFGGGISTLEIVNLKTMGHHWKEFSLRELQHYFCLLSPDFNCVKGEYTSDEVAKSSRFQRRFKWFRQGLHVEIEVAEKRHGIIARPGW